MGRIRSIRPEVLTDFTIASLPDLAHRLLFGLYSLVDDAGRAPADPAFVAGAILWAVPRSADEVARAMALLVERELIKTYEVKGVALLEIAGWFDDKSATYQRIEKPQPSKLPMNPSKSRSRNRSKTDSRNGSGNDSRRDWDLEREGEKEVERERSTRSRAVPIQPSSKLSEQQSTELRDLWETLFRKRHHTVSALSTSALKKLGAIALESDEVKRRIGEFFSRAPNAWPLDGSTVDAFVRSIDRWVPKINGRTLATSDEHARDAERDPLA